MEMKKERKTSRLISMNWMILMYFEIIYKTLGYCVVFPFIQKMLSLLPGLAGLSYLSQENTGELLRHPLSALLIVVILVLSAVFILFEIVAFMLLCEKGWHQEKFSLGQLFGQTAAKTLSLLRPRRIGIIMMLPLLVLSVFSPVSAYLKKIRIPEYILQHIWEDRVLSAIYLAVLVLVHMLLFFYLFGLPAMLFSGCSYLQSWKESLGLIRGKKWKTAGFIGLRITGFIFKIFTLICLCVLVLGGYTRIRYQGLEGRSVLQLSLPHWLRILGMVGSTLASACLCAVIVSLYHLFKGERLITVKKEKTEKGYRWKQTVSIVLMVIVLFFWGETEIAGGVQPLLDREPVVVAHRAGAAWAPENTLAALEDAVDGGADAVEIDIQQLADSTLIVMHDTNFRRTTGKDLDVWNADRGMIRNLNAGAYFKRDRVTEKIPTLEEFLAAAKGKTRVMIELKSTGHERAFERNVLAQVKKYGMEKECMLASMDLEILKRVKELSPEMETVYISAILIADRFDLAYVDGYSIEATSLSRGMSLQAHFQGKKVYGWTANSDHTIKKVLGCEVDGLITDNVRYAGSFLRKYGKNMVVEDIVELFYGEVKEKGMGLNGKETVYGMPDE